MKLIDVDALKKDLESVTLSNGTLVNTNAVLHLLEEYPTAYDVDKVVEQLKECERYVYDAVSDEDNYVIDTEKAIEIVSRPPCSWCGTKKEKEEI